MANTEQKKNTEQPVVKKPAKAVLSPEQKKNRAFEILKKEYAFENWLLAILSPVLILYGVYIVMGKFGTVNLANILGRSGTAFIDFFFETTLKRVLTGSFLIVVGSLVIVYLASPFLRPSLEEMKKVSWPTAKSLATNSGKVFFFLVFLMLVFTIYGFVLDPLFQWLYSL